MAHKHANHLFIFFVLILSTMFWMMPGHVLALCTIDSNGTYIEAEHFTGSYQEDDDKENGDYFELEEDTTANGGYVLKSGDNGYHGNTPAKEVKTYDVHFEVGTYYMWMRGKGFSGSEDSMYFAVYKEAENIEEDDENIEGWKAWNFSGVYNQFIWTKSMQVGGDNQIEISTPGTYTIRIAMRERNTEIDGFYITTENLTTLTDSKVAAAKEIDPEAGCGSTWTADPSNLEPTTFRGYNPAPNTLTLNITRAGTSDTPATTITSSADWAKINVADSTVPALTDASPTHQVTVTFETAGELVGIHTATLTVAGSGSGENAHAPLEIPITLLVKASASTAACGEIPLYAENLVNPAIMVQLDTSGSMGNKESVTITNADGTTETTTMSRIGIAEDVLKETFLDRSISWGFATWAGGNGNAGDSDNYPTYYTTYRIGCHDHDQDHQDALQAKSDDGSASGWTPLVPTMKAALAYFKGERNDSHYGEAFTKLTCQPRILVLVTDGLGNTGTNNTKINAITDALIAEGITIVAVGFGLDDASQLDLIVNKMKTAGTASEDDYLYHLHDEDSNGDPVPFMAQNRQEFMNAMNRIVTGVKAQVFHGASPAPTTSVDNGAILLNASFDASDWSGNLKATKFNAFTGVLESNIFWQTDDTVTKQNTTNPINPFIYDADETDHVSVYTAASIDGDNFLCKAMGDIINSTPAIVGAPPYFYKFGDDDGITNLYYNFKYNAQVNSRDEIAYFGANDGALHAVCVKDGTEKWRFYPQSVISKMAQEGSAGKDPCSPAYCHQFRLDGVPQPADIYVDADTKWRTILVTGLGKGGSAFFALDITYGNDFGDQEDGKGDPAKYLWEFNQTDDAQLGYATSWPTTARLSNGEGTGWATIFGSGEATDTSTSMEAYLFAVNSYDKEKVWITKEETTAEVETTVEGVTTVEETTVVVDTPVYKIKLSSSTLGNDVPSPPHLVDINDDEKYDRIYVGNMYGNLYRVKDIGFSQAPQVELFFDSETKEHLHPVTAKPDSGYGQGEDIWIFFGTGKYQVQIDKTTSDQQYFFGLLDGASTSLPYKESDLISMQTQIISAYALDENGDPADVDNDGNVDTDDLRQYRTVSCTSPDQNGRCNPNNNSWMLKLATPSAIGSDGSTTALPSERSISQPLVVGGVVFFTTFIPDGDVCQGNGDTYLFAVDWESGEFVSNEVFDINGDNQFTDADQTVQGSDGDGGGGALQKVAGLYIGTGKPVPELVLHNDILFVGTTDNEPAVIKINLDALKSRLKSWKRQFNE